MSLLEVRMNCRLVSSSVCNYVIDSFAYVQFLPSETWSLERYTTLAYRLDAITSDVSCVSVCRCIGVSCAVMTIACENADYIGQTIARSSVVSLKRLPLGCVTSPRRHSGHLTECYQCEELKSAATSRNLGSQC